MIRKTAVAGAFYPANKKTLSDIVDKYLASAKNLNLKDLRGIIVPHAGYIYSGIVAAEGFKQLMALPEKKYNVFLLGPTHYTYTTASIGVFEEFETPLGNIKVNREICNELKKNNDIDHSVEAHIPEHSLEVELPFLIKTLKDFSIIPILLGNISPEKISAILDPYFKDEENIFVVSSDLSHYLPYKEAISKDKTTLDIISTLEIKNESRIDACGERGVKVIMRLAKNNSCKISVLDYRNSGDTAGDKNAVVGYSSLAITK